MTCRTWSWVVGVCLCGPALAIAQDIPRLRTVPERLSEPGHARLLSQRNALVIQLQSVNQAIGQFNSRCTGAQVKPDCAPEASRVSALINDYSTAASAFNKAVDDAMAAGLVGFLKQSTDYRKLHPDAGARGEPIDPRDAPTVTRLRDRVFVGGTGWVYGYVRRKDANLERVAKEDFKAARDLSAKTTGADGFMDPDDYDMVVGIASNHYFLADLVDRVVGWPSQLGSDQNTLGSFLAESQPLYASLRGTRTSRLDCHSNGAMICLHALLMGDIDAPGPGGTGPLAVTLFGPQLTPAALREWKRLLDKGDITSLEINVNEGDPVPTASYEAGDHPWATAALHIAKALAPLALGLRGQPRIDLTQLDFFSRNAAEKLRVAIVTAAPRIRVNVRADATCLQKLRVPPGRLNTDAIVGCHDMRVYQAPTR